MYFYKFQINIYVLRLHYQSDCLAIWLLFALKKKKIKSYIFDFDYLRFQSSLAKKFYRKEVFYKKFNLNWLLWFILDNLLDTCQPASSKGIELRKLWFTKLWNSIKPSNVLSLLSLHPFNTLTFSSRSVAIALEFEKEASVPVLLKTQLGLEENLRILLKGFLPWLNLLFNKNTLRDR